MYRRQSAYQMADWMHGPVDRLQHELSVFAFDLLHRDGVDLRPLALSKRKELLGMLVRRSKVDCLHLVATFPDGPKLLASAERLGLEGIVRRR